VGKALNVGEKMNSQGKLWVEVHLMWA